MTPIQQVPVLMESFGGESIRQLNPTPPTQMVESCLAGVGPCEAVSRGAARRNSSLTLGQAATLFGSSADSAFALGRCLLWSTGKLASPSAAVARIAAMTPKGKGKSAGGKGKGKGKPRP